MIKLDLKNKRRRYTIKSEMFPKIIKRSNTLKINNKWLIFLIHSISLKNPYLNIGRGFLELLK